VRLIDPMLPEGATLPPPGPAGWFDPNGNPIPEILNHTVNFGWEYVWHCHILSHEEMDMMHSLVFAVPPKAPINLTVAVQGGRATLNWTDTSNNETNFRIQRASDPGFTTGLTTFTVGQNVTTYVDNTIQNNRTYSYRVLASNLVGDTQVYANSTGFPTMSADSAFSNTASVGAAAAVPADPTALSATLQAGPQVSLTWTDNASNETGFVVERCTGGGCANFAQIAAPGPRNNTGNVTYVDTTVTAGNSYSYRVKAVNAAGSSVNYTNIATVDVATAPAAPTSFVATNTPANGQNSTIALTWVHPGGANLTGFTIQRATNATFTTGLNTVNPGAAARSLTQTVRDNTTYYYRIRANGTGGSSAWTNALPFPIRTAN
jgi:fibronectin type 3 domain-containing protein